MSTPVELLYDQINNLIDELKKAEAENARLKAEVERLKLDYYENKTGEVSATVVQTFNTETGEADYVVSLDDYKKMADMFNAEFLRLKAEIERLTKHDDDTCPHLVRANLLEAENARLKAEVEELKAQPDPLTAYLYAAKLAKDDIKRLKAEVERLTKAGDAMAFIMAHQKDSEFNGFIEDWNAAKEGKPS